jgi:putative SOS response-associated peptidase YedK
MCGRFTLKTHPDAVSRLFGSLSQKLLQSTIKFNPSYNIAPTQNVRVARHIAANGSDEEESGAVGNRGTELVQLRWGLVPFWAKDLKIGSRMINARCETVATKPSFRSAFKKRRCLVVADGFYEWKKMGDHKQPYYISMSDEQPFCFAGLWEWWGKDDQRVETCTVITTDANDMMQALHDRMPVIMDPNDFDAWLDPEFQDFEELQNKLTPFDSAEMKAVPVSTFVNKPANNTAACIKPVII